MNLLDVVLRQPPQPWVDGEKIPWDEPGFSARMLAEHLSQTHDAASRRSHLIDAHVAWIDTFVLGGRASTVLDLGCGPGLYLNRLARRGHQGVGIDFSPASIAYARTTAEAEGLAAAYRLADLRTADFGSPPYDLALLLYGEFNTFRPAVARDILQRAHAVLRPGGRLLLEPSTFESIAALGAAPPGWYAAETGLWAAGPHIVLQDNGWDAEHAVAVERYVVVDALTGAPVQHAMTTQAYPTEELVALLVSVGFADPQIYPSLAPGAAEPQAGFYAVLAQKPG
jgi:SAM-dependent methyltransferase